MRKVVAASVLLLSLLAVADSAQAACTVRHYGRAVVVSCHP